MASSTQAIPRARANVERKIAASLEDGRLNNNNTNLSKGKRNIRASSSSSNKLKLYYKYCFGILASLYIFFHYILSDQLQFETVKIILLMCGGIETSFKSQHGQDRFAYKTFFPDTSSGGTFVEFGARNGVSHSNTWYFEHEHKWHGILLEPGPEYFQIENNRPRSISFHNTACMQDKYENKKRIFIVADTQGWHGFKDTYDKERLKELIARDGIKQELIIQCKSIPNILQNLNMRRVNYMTVDTEGGEVDFLLNFPFHKFVIDVIQVEIRCIPGSGACTDGVTAKDVMERFGYMLHTKYRVDSETEDYFFQRTAKVDSLRGILNGNFTA